MRTRPGNSGLRYRPLVRALRIFVALCRTRFGLTIPQLLDEVECSRRTLYRYLDALQEAGVRISAEINSTTRQVFRRVEHVDGRRVRVSA